MVSGVGIHDLRFTSQKVRSTFREIRAGRPGPKRTTGIEPATLSLGS
jgi:hypothetical protein